MIVHLLCFTATHANCEFFVNQNPTENQFQYTVATNRYLARYMAMWAEKPVGPGPQSSNIHNNKN